MTSKRPMFTDPRDGKTRPGFRFPAAAHNALDRCVVCGKPITTAMVGFVMPTLDIHFMCAKHVSR